jgi:predicted AAA+ superfamily ATPase
MALKPWYKVLTPREDLRLGKPLDASEFAVHLGRVKDGKAPDYYQNPENFFERTYLTQNLTNMAAEVVRRLSGEKTESSAVYNLNTQFGGGKTHTLTLLYHLAKNGSNSESWPGVNKILTKSGIETIPKAKVAVFVGNDFDSKTGRGGNDGTPLRKTPWGEIAFQLGGEEAFALVGQHEADLEAPGSDVIRQILPKDKPCLILMDELMNYVSRSRRSGLSSQLYNFIQNLSETARGEENVVLVISVPASELEMTPEDHTDYSRIKKLLDRLSKAIIISTETDISEIIRRRLFEFDSKSLDLSGRAALPEDARQTCREYARLVRNHRQQIPSWFPIDNAEEAFEAAYPFHPMVFSVFERKWQALPSFQRTRGVLRLLALWVSKAYRDGFLGAHADPLVGLGTAPLDDPFFRAAAIEQLGEDRLEVPITTDICGDSESHSTRLDYESADSIKKARLHRKVATSIFFESNGGRTSGTDASIPEIRLDVAEPDLDIGNVETVLSDLETTCYFLNAEGSRYHFSLKPNVNQIACGPPHPKGRGIRDPPRSRSNKKRAVRPLSA